MAKFIKITQTDEKELIINTDFIKIVEKLPEEEKGAVIYFNDGDTIEVQEDFLEIQKLSND